MSVEQTPAELDERTDEQTIEDELEKLTHAQEVAGRVTSAAEVEESRRLAIARPLPLHLDEARGEYGLGYN